MDYLTKEILLSNGYNIAILQGTTDAIVSNIVWQESAKLW